MTSKQKIIIAILAIVAAGSVAYFTVGRNALRQKKAQQTIKINNEDSQQSQESLNTGPVSPLSGLSCNDWNRRPMAVMQPADVSARPAAGFSDADMVFEMPVITASITRLMGVYVCGNPDDVGSMRSARHDFASLAAGLDAIFVHWGRSNIDKFKDVLNSRVIDDMNCNNDAGQSAEQYCYRKEATGTMRGVDTGYAKFAKLLEGAQKFGYRMTDNFSGYPHQDEAPLDQRGNGGHLRVAFAGPFAVEYDYDKNTNTYLRTWGNVADTDRNNGKRLAPKNVVVLIAKSTQLVEGEQYNNVQLGDPWFDDTDNGEAHYYMNGREYRGTWKKEMKLGSKLYFYDDMGKEVKFVPGQIWVDILEPGQNLKWTPIN
jgi:hypothetical protein